MEIFLHNLEWLIKSKKRVSNINIKTKHIESNITEFLALFSIIEKRELRDYLTSLLRYNFLINRYSYFYNNVFLSIEFKKLKENEII